MIPASRTIHWNDPKTNGRTRCGRRLHLVIFRDDPNDATCNRCIQLHELDQKDAKVQDEMQAWREPPAPYNGGAQ